MFSLQNNLQFHKLTYITYTFLVKTVSFDHNYIWQDLYFDSVRLLSWWCTVIGTIKQVVPETHIRPLAATAGGGTKLLVRPTLLLTVIGGPLVLSPSDTGHLCGNLEQRNNAMGISYWKSLAYTAIPCPSMCIHGDSEWVVSCVSQSRVFANSSCQHHTTPPPHPLHPVHVSPSPAISLTQSDLHK